MYQASMQLENQIIERDKMRELEDGRSHIHLVDVPLHR